MLKVKYFILLISGALSLGLSFGTKLYFPLAFFSLIPLLVTEDFLYKNKNHYSPAYAFSAFYIYFIVFHIASAWWTYYSSLAGFFAVIFLNALYLSLPIWVFHVIRKNFNVYFAYLFFICSWITIEFIHYKWELAWPWLTLGNGLGNQTKLIQWYEYTGVLGGSLWILLINILLYHLIKKSYRIYKIPSKSLFQFTILIFSIAIPIIYSFYLLNNFIDEGKKFNVKIIQPNLRSYTEKYSIDQQTQMQRILKLFINKQNQYPDYVIIPETALPGMQNLEHLNEEENIKIFLKQADMNPNLNIITGASTFYQINNKTIPTQYKKQFKNGASYMAYNTLLQVNHERKFQKHHKSKLVLGVEKMPFGNIFTFIEKYAVNLGGIIGSVVPDSSTNLIYNTDSSCAILPIICFESVFGDYLSKFHKNSNYFICIITNDDWWGNTPGYKQHLMEARLRAIEMRKYVARAANTGISAIIDPWGNILNKTAWAEETSLSGIIHANKSKTFYIQFPNLIGILSGTMCLLLLIIGIYKLIFYVFFSIINHLKNLYSV